MPVYEYRCQDCGGVTGAFLRNRQKATDVCCQQCGSERLGRASLSSIALVRSGPQQESCSNPGRCCQRQISRAYKTGA